MHWITVKKKHFKSGDVNLKQSHQLYHFYFILGDIIFVEMFAVDLKLSRLCFKQPKQQTTKSNYACK